MLVGLTRPFGARFGLLLRKEMRLFFRDSSQSSQLILLLSLVVVYVYNFSVLPLAGGPLVTFYFRNFIAFLNLALAAMVTASVAVRFVYPSFSLEGRALWILQAAPLDLRLGIVVSLATAAAICLGTGAMATHRGLERLHRLEL